MAGFNKISRSRNTKIGAKIIRRIIRCFAQDLTVKEATNKAGVSRTTITGYYKKLRFIVGTHCHNFNSVEIGQITEYANIYYRLKLEMTYNVIEKGLLMPTSGGYLYVFNNSDRLLLNKQSISEIRMKPEKGIQYIIAEDIARFTDYRLERKTVPKHPSDIEKTETMYRCAVNTYHMFQHHLFNTEAGLRVVGTFKNQKRVEYDLEKVNNFYVTACHKRNSSLIYKDLTSWIKGHPAHF